LKSVADKRKLSGRKNQEFLAKRRGTQHFLLPPFHHSAQMHNRITSLRKLDGTRLETHQEIEQELVSFYGDLVN
jgi:hypothetical protein